MAENRRNTSILLLVCVLLGTIIFYGCGGGGSSSDPLPIAPEKTYQIAGRVTASEVVLNMAPSVAADLRAASNMTGILVYLESNRQMYNTRTASDGTYLLRVPQGTHNIVAVIPAEQSITGKTYKVRSPAISVTDANPTVEASTLNLKPAEAVITGTVKDPSGNPITTARVIVWGEEVQVDSSGVYRVFMPDNTNTEIRIISSGYQDTTLQVIFDNDSPQFIEQTIVSNAATNRAPIASLSANLYRISVGSKAVLKGSVFDPDGDLLNISFTTSTGTIEHTDSSSLEARFSALGNTIATVTMTAQDPQGLKAVANVRIEVGTGGVVASNSIPVISAIEIDGTTFQSGQSYQLSVQATDADKDLLYYSWVIDSEFGTITPNNRSTGVWSIPQLSQEKTASITVIVTDGKSAPVSLNRSFVVQPDPELINNQPPLIEIVSPTNNQLFVAGESVSFVASATDPNTPLSYKWDISYLDQNNYVNVSNQQSFSRYSVSTGTYYLRLTVSDKFQASRSVTQTFRINNKPVAQITLPVPGGTPYAPGQTITFNGNAADIEDGNLSGANLVWTFPGNSHQTGASVNFSSLPLGSSTVSFSAYDSKNEWAATKTIELYTNATPTISTILPANGTVYQVGDTVTLNGSAGDPDIFFQPLTYTWSSGSAIIANGNPASFQATTAGVYHVTLMVHDGTTGLASSTASYTRIIVNQPPMMNITNPAPNAIIGIGNQFNIAGNGLSTLGTAVQASTMNWQDSFNNATNTINAGNASFQQTYSLPVDLGWHYLTLTGADEYGVNGSTTIRFYVNATPTVLLVEPASGTRFDTGATIAFQATANDENLDQTPTIQWFSTTSGYLGAGSTLNYSTLPSGYHNVFCIASDSNNYYAVSSYTGILVNTLPTGNVHITSASFNQYATAPQNVPIYLSEVTSMQLNLGITTSDVEDGTITGSNVGWFVWDGVEYDHIGSTTVNFDQIFSLGSNTIKVEIYDSYYNAGFPATQTMTVIYQPVHIWQSVTYPNSYGSLTPNPVYIDGSSLSDSFELLLTENGATPATRRVRGIAWDGKKAINQLSTDYTGYAPSTIATYPTTFAAVKCGVRFEGNMVMLGTIGANDSLFKFLMANEEGDDFPNNPVSAGATSIVFNSEIAAQKLAYATTSGKVFAFDSDSGNLAIPSLELTSAGGTNLGNTLRVRFNHMLPSGYGNLFVADTANDRIVMTFQDFSGAIPLSATDTIDVAFSQTFIFSLNDTTNEITMIDPASRRQLMTFAGTSANPGFFNNVIGIFCSGYDLFAIESNGDLKVIRSGMSDWLIGSRLW